MANVRILWADDEIDLLKPQLFFLEKKGYDVLTVSNGYDAIDTMDEHNDIDVVFLDESMPGLSGLETLEKIKSNHPRIPVVMITKNEAEDVMEQAIGSQIDDYLIKPVNPNQILLTLKKIIDNKRLVSEKTATDYQIEFRNIALEINSGLNVEEWNGLYRRIIDWELKLDRSDNAQLKEILDMQKREANKEFSKFVEKHYGDWVNDPSFTMSYNLLKHKLFPALDPEKPTFFVLLDNLRYDQWKILEPLLNEFYRVKREELFYSILPTSTQYSRNAIFAGMKPLDIERTFPQYWLNDHERGGKNQYESELFATQAKRLYKKPLKWDYVKVTRIDSAKALSDNILNYLNNDLTIVVYNFIDMLSHARTEMEVLKELAVDEKAYRSLTRSWFLNSPLWAALQKIAGKDVQLFITTDHGTIRVSQPSRVIADRETTTNLRYKVGKNLQYERSDVLEFRDPSKAGLPSPNLSSTFIFAKEDIYFLYPNNYSHYNRLYNDTFQHGGISLEEIVCPFIELETKT